MLSGVESLLYRLTWRYTVKDPHYTDVIMSAMASQITDVSIVWSAICSGADQRKHQSSASLVFVRGIRWWLVNSPHKGPVTRKMFPFDDVIILEYSGVSSKKFKMIWIGSVSVQLTACQISLTTKQKRINRWLCWKFERLCPGHADGDARARKNCVLCDGNPSVIVGFRCEVVLMRTCIFMSLNCWINDLIEQSDGCFNGHVASL